MLDLVWQNHNRRGRTFIPVVFSAAFCFGVLWYLSFPLLSTRSSTPQNSTIATDDYTAAAVKFALENGFQGVDSSPATRPSPTAEVLPPLASTPTIAQPIGKRPLILYAFFDTTSARRNLEFFIQHGLHGAADFIFIFNGDSDAPNLVPKEPNIKIVQRENHCYDLGAFAEVLLEDELYTRYERFILLNASIRGPFLPVWAHSVCWSDAYLNLLTDEIKLVGMTMNCVFTPHIQSMIWALDRPGIETLLFPSKDQVQALSDFLEENPGPMPALAQPGLASCPNTYHEAVSLEVYATPLMRASGWKVAAVMSAYWSKVGASSYPPPAPPTNQTAGTLSGTPYLKPNVSFENFYDQACTHDVIRPGAYYGIDLHPFETMFLKTNRGVAPKTLQLLTEWADGSGVSSWGACGKGR